MTSLAPVSLSYSIARKQGPAAICLTKRRSVTDDLVSSDTMILLIGPVMLPRLNGYEVARRIRQQPCGSGCRPQAARLPWRGRECGCRGWSCSSALLVENVKDYAIFVVDAGGRYLARP
jgi:hypothetical protein